MRYIEKEEIEGIINGAVSLKDSPSKNAKGDRLNVAGEECAAQAAPERDFSHTGPAR